MVVQVHDKNTKRSITIQILLLAVQHIVHDGLLVVESFAFFRVSASTDQQTIDIYIIDNFGQINRPCAKIYFCRSHA